ncbi:MAG: choice-of-anchor J domain-containing protein [Roseateles sp.]
MKTSIAGLCLATLGLVGGSAQAAATLISEGFDNLGTLGGSGWLAGNFSTPVGSTGWFQGNAGPFAAHSGPANSYIAANFNNGVSGGSISNWLVTPVFSTTSNGFLSFFTRTDELLGLFGDSLEVRFNATGSTNLADFVTVLTVNGNQDVDGYPDGWTEFSTSWAGTGGATQGRYAFVYRVDNADNANFIGIDTVTVALPEPASMALVLGALGGLGFASRRRKA